jgi:hypothetical protein
VLNCLTMLLFVTNAVPLSVRVRLKREEEVRVQLKRKEEHHLPRRTNSSSLGSNVSKMRELWRSHSPKIRRDDNHAVEFHNSSEEALIFPFWNADEANEKEIVTGAKKIVAIFGLDRYFRITGISERLFKSVK